MTTAIVLTGARASSAAICPRRAVYEHHDAPREESTEQMKGWFRRGHAWARVVREAIVEGLHEEGRRPRIEEVIPWPARDPIGEGHADLYIPHEQRIIEVVSNAGATLPSHKPLQAGLYIRNHPRATCGDVLAVDTHTGEERIYPVEMAGLAEELDKIESQVLAGIRDGEIPPRVGDAPWSGPCAMCAFSRHCWDGWERPDPEALPEFAADLARLADLEDAIAAMKAGESIMAEREEVRARLRGHIVAGHEYESGGIRVKRTEVAGSETFSLKAMRDAGHTLPEDLAPFVNRGRGSERWTVKRRET